MGFFNNVGLSAHYSLSGSSSSAAFDLRRLVYPAVGEVIRKNRILSAIPVNEGSPDGYFASLPSINLKRSIFFLGRSKPLASDGKGVDEELDALLQDQHNINFKSEYSTLPFWRLIILQNPGIENNFTASFIYHHAIGDGLSGLVFHKAFRDALEAASCTLANYKTEEIAVPDENISILPPLEDLHPLPISPTPATLPATTLQEWAGNSINTPCKSRWSSLCLSPNASAAFF